MENIVKWQHSDFLHKVTFMLLWLRRKQLPSFEIYILSFKIATH